MLRGNGKEKEGTPIFRFDGGICGGGGESGVVRERAIFRFVRLRCLAAITRAGNYDFVVISGRTDDGEKEVGGGKRERERKDAFFPSGFSSFPHPSRPVTSPYTRSTSRRFTDFSSE